MTIDIPPMSPMIRRNLLSFVSGNACKSLRLSALKECDIRQRARNVFVFSRENDA